MFLDSSSSPRTDSRQVNLTLLGHWLQIQLSIAVICACLPTYGPLLPSATLLTRMKGWVSSVTSILQKRRQNSSSSSSSADSKTALCSNCKNSIRPQKDPYGSLGHASENTVVTSVFAGEGGGRGRTDSYLQSHHHGDGEAEVAAAGGAAAATANTDHHHPDNFIRIRNEVEMV